MSEGYWKQALSVTINTNVFLALSHSHAVQLETLCWTVMGSRADGWHFPSRLWEILNIFPCVGVKTLQLWGAIC